MKKIKKNSIKIFIIFITLFILIFGFFYLNKNEDILENKKEKNRDFSSGMLVSEGKLVFDFGDIDIFGGIVKKDFKFTNDSDMPLNIFSITTSCGCTTAELVYKEKTYGPFSMHSQNEIFEILPKEDFTVRAMYNPLAHGPNDIGYKNRTIFLFTSSEIDGKTTRTYPSQYDSFTEIKVFGNVKKSE